LAADENGEVVIYAFGEKIEAKASYSFKAAIIDALLLPDRNRAVLLVARQGIFVWDYVNNKLIGSIKDARFEHFRMLPDEKTVVATTIDGSVVFWEMNSENPKKKVSFKDDRPWSIALSPDGKKIALGHGGPGVVLLYGIEDFQKPTRLTRQDRLGTMHRLVFSRDGRYLFSCTDLAGYGKNGIVGWDLMTNAKIVEYKYPISVEDVAVWPNGAYIAGTDLDGDLILLKASKDKKQK
jgi:WD40 repeat protein